jgi:hypothetical protein
MISTRARVVAEMVKGALGVVCATAGDAVTTTATPIMRI